VSKICHHPIALEEVAMLELNRRLDHARRGDRIWPFGVIPALVSAGIMLVALLVTVTLLATLANWPEKRWQGWLVLGAVLLALIPLLLLILDRVSRTGGSVEFRGIKIAFAAEAAQTTVTLPANMGIPAGAPVADSGSFQIQAAMREAVKNDVLVVDLEEGSAWWETRLLTLCLGAERRGVRALVFVGTDRMVARTFQGWAPPGRLGQALLDTNPELRRAADIAAVNTQRWRLAYPPSPPGSDPYIAASNPLPDPRADHKAFIAFEGSERNTFADDQFLLAELAPLEQWPVPISIIRLLDLFGPILHAAALEEQDSQDAWLRAALSVDDDYLAVTRGQVYVGLLSRTTVLTRIVGALAAKSTAF
jgi:hypothetical protein